MVSFWAAVLVGYSRIYLGQHFLEDVIAGIITGVASAILVEYLFNLYLTRTQAARKSTANTYEQPAAIRL